tara:strand:+ start:187 stop:1677 length:1491 start_codon:yes stop_codon:yes gene_type:complete
LSSYYSRFIRLIAVFGIFVLPVTALAACGNSSDDETSEMNKGLVEESDKSNSVESTQDETSQTDEDEKSSEVKEEVSAEEENGESTPEPPVDTEEENEESTPEPPANTGEEDEESTPEPPANTGEENEEEQEAAIEAILTNTYSWGDGTAFATRQLQEILETNVDGTYGTGTRLAHLVALQERGLSTDNVPEEPLSDPTAPGSPTNVSATANSSLITVNWDPPADNGGAEVTSYSVTSEQLSGVTCNRTATDGIPAGQPCQFGSDVGVEPGVSYTFSVVAQNAIGTSEPLLSQATTLALQEIAISLNLDTGNSTNTSFTANNVTLNFSAAGTGTWNGGLRSYAQLAGGDGWVTKLYAGETNSATFTITNNTGYECIKLASFKVKSIWTGIPELEIGPELTSVVANMYAQGSQTAVPQYTGLSLGPFDLSQDFDDAETSIITVQTPNSPCDTATVTLVPQWDMSSVGGVCDIMSDPECYDGFRIYLDQIELIGYAAP